MVRDPQTCELPMIHRVSCPRGACQSSRQPWISGCSQTPCAVKVKPVVFSQSQVPRNRISKLVRLNWNLRLGISQSCHMLRASGPFGSRLMFLAMQAAETLVAMLTVKKRISPCEPPLDPFTVTNVGL